MAIVNTVVIVTYALNYRLQTSANRFVIALAVSDLLVSILLVPVKTWLPSSELIGPLTAFILLASLFNICGCTYDRYIAIKNPLHYPSIMTLKRFFQVMVVVWLFPLIIAIIPQIWMRNSEALQVTPLESFIYEQRYVAFMAILVVVVCCVLVAVYIYIFSVAKRHYKAMKIAECPLESMESKDTKGKKRRSQAVRNFFYAIKSTVLFATIGANFLFCWFPLILVNFAFAFDQKQIVSKAFMNVGEILMYVNSFLNPVAYAFFQKEFRRTILKVCMKKSISPSETTFHECNTSRADLR